MKQKIKEALKQGHKKLGVSDEVFERVAASVETFITDESQIAGFVASENTLNLLKSYQSMADKIRDLERINPQPNNEPNPQPSDNGNQTPPNPQQSQPDIAAAVAAAVAAEMAKVVTPLQEKLQTFEAAQLQKSAIAALDELKSSWDWAKGYPEESADAYDRTLELYEVTGKKWSADELTAKFKEKFNNAVKKRGIEDTNKPFDGDSGGSTGNLKTRFEAFAKRQAERAASTVAE